MATIGLSKPIYSKYSNSGTTVTYDGPVSLGKAVELSVEMEEGENNNFYADNGIAESDNQFSSASMTITTDELNAANTLAILGLVSAEIEVTGVTTSNPSWIIYDDRQVVPNVGFGGVIKKQVNGATKYNALILPKVKFSNPGINAVTQGESIEWQTKELSATVMRDDTTNHPWQYLSSDLDSEADAVTIINDFFAAADPEED